MPVRSHMKGFTLIELIIVITILGILASVALPRFIDIQRDARIAKLEAARGAVAAASAIVHAAMLAKRGVADTVACPGGGGTANNDPTGAGTLCTEAGVIATLNAYPAVNALGSTPPGLAAAAGLTSVFNPSVADLQAEGYQIVGGGAIHTFRVLGATTITQCQFTYTEAAAGAAPLISATVTTGC